MARRRIVETGVPVSGGEPTWRRYARRMVDQLRVEGRHQHADRLEALIERGRLR